jgi:hypothetical protein
MEEGFRDILSAFRAGDLRDQHALGVSVAANVLTNGLQLANDLYSNKIVVGKHPAVEGTRLQKVEPQRIMSESMLGLVGTDAWVFELTNMQFQPSLVSLATNMLNLSAHDVGQSAGSGAYLFLNHLLQRISKETQVPLSAREYVGVLNEFIRTHIAPLNESLQYLDLQVFINVVEPQGGKNRLRWLYFAASPAVDLYGVKQVDELVYLCLHKDDMGAQVDLTHMFATNADREAYSDDLPEMKDSYPIALQVPLNEDGLTKYMVVVIHDSRDEMGCLRLISAL